MFPKPYPDELLGSVLTRAYRHLGLKANSLHKAFGFPAMWVGTFVSLQHMPKFADLLQVPVEELLRNHSVFYYATAFWSAEMFEETRREVLSGYRMGPQGLLRTSAALTQAVTMHSSFKRLCRVCMSEDKALYGESYWHRRHNLPGSYFCLKHDEWLCNTPIRVTDSSKKDCHLLPQHARRRQIQLRMSKIIARDLASRNEGLLDGEPNQLWQDVYRTLASEKGYQLSDKLYASVGLEESLTKFFGPAVIRDLNLPLQSMDGRGGWPALLLRPSTRLECIASTVKHVLLRTFLENCGPATYTFQYPVPGKKTASRRMRDAKTARAIFRRMAEAQQTGERLKVSTLMIEIGAWCDFRHRPDLYPRTQAAILKLRESPVSIRPIKKTPPG